MLLDSSYLRFCAVNDYNPRISTHPINALRDEFGEYHHLFQELKCYPVRFKEYTRMNINTFDILLSILKDDLSKQETNWRKPIYAEERLVITVR